MNEILKLWTKDRFQLTIWLLCFLLLTLAWTLLPEIELIQKLSEQPKPILLTSIVLNIAISLSFIRFRYQTKKDVFKDYYFFPTAKAWRHKTKLADRACAKCKVEGKFSPLALTENQNSFVCPCCGSETPNIPIEIFTTNNNVNVIVPMTPKEKT